jgi:alkylhydroperoxidase family enzyme
MPRVPPLADEELSPAARLAVQEHASHGHRVTNMKRTLAHSVPAFRALMEWYPLRDAVEPFLGARLTNLFVHAISTRTDCLICSTFFRRILIDAGEDPDHLKLDAREQTVVDYGRQLAADPNGVSDALHQQLAALFDHEQLVALTAFGAIMVATNIFNNALQVPLDDYLKPYRKERA